MGACRVPLAAGGTVRAASHPQDGWAAPAAADRVTTTDRLLLSGLALLVVQVVRLPPGDPVAQITQLVWLGVNVVWALVVLLRCRTKPGVVSGSAPPQVRLVEDQLEAFRTAGFTDTQAHELMQEAMRTAIKAQGGWQP